MQVTLGAQVVATLIAPSVLPAATMGARIEVPYTRAIISYWRPAAYDPVTGVWTVVLDPPLSADEYQLVWRTDDPEPPELETFIPLSVVSGTTAAIPFPVDELPVWAPSVEDVAAVSPAYSRGGFDDDREFAGAESHDGEGQPTFTESTSPTRSNVEGLIAAACEEVQGRVGVLIPVQHYGLAKATAKWHVAAMIASGKKPAGTDDATGVYSGLIGNFRNSLDELVRLARMGGTRLA